MPDLPAMHGVTGFSTRMRYLWMNTLIVDQKPWERMTFGRVPPGKSQRMAEFSTIVSGTCVRGVESRDSLGYPVGEASAEKGPT